MKVVGDDHSVSLPWVHLVSHSRNRKLIWPFECVALLEEANAKCASVSAKDFFSSQMTVGANVAPPKAKTYTKRVGLLKTAFQSQGTPSLQGLGFGQTIHS